LAHAVAYPVKAHVNGFGAALLHGVIGNARGSAVIGLNGSGRLGMCPSSSRQVRREDMLLCHCGRGRQVRLRRR
jgi:hypothetical protein